jgi:hypothetical protein
MHPWGVPPLSVHCIRRTALFIASGVLVGYVALIIYGLVREPLHSHLLGGLTATLVAWGFVGAYELIVRSQPPTQAIVARTVEALEEERERQAAEGLPRIALGENWR